MPPQKASNSISQPRVKMMTFNIFLPFFEFLYRPKKNPLLTCKTLRVAHIIFPFLLAFMNAPAQIKYTGTIGKNKIVLRLNYPIVQATEPAYFHTHTEVVGSYGYNRYKKPFRFTVFGIKEAPFFWLKKTKPGPSYSLSIISIQIKNTSTAFGKEEKPYP